MPGGSIRFFFLRLSTSCLTSAPPPPPPPKHLHQNNQKQKTGNGSKTVVVDARGHMLGRLASVVAKQLLTGNHIVVVRAEEAVLSGGLVRQRAKYERFLRKRMLTQPKKGPIHFRAPSRIVWRTVRGMIPHKTKRGAAALDRLKSYEGVPPPYDKVKRVVVPDALKVLRLAHGHKFVRLGELSASVGWKHADAVAGLEEERKSKAAEWHKERSKAAAKRAAAVKAVDA